MADFILGRLKFKWKGDWATATGYIVDDIVKYGANSYVCIANHTSNDFYTDLGTTYWSLFTESFSYNTTNTAWQNNTAYKINDVVRWGANLYVCNTQHTSGSSWSTNSSKFTLFLPGLEFEDSWSSSTQYQIGDIVTYGGYSYIAKIDNLNKIPSSNTNEWDIVTTGYNNRGDYNSSTAYKVGDVIRHGAYTYVCKTDHDGSANPTTTTGNTTSTNTSYWDLLNKGLRYRSDNNNGDWTTGVLYLLGDVVTNGSSSYVCIQEHTSSNSETPGAAANHWDLLSAGDSTNVMTTEGDLLTRDSTTNQRLQIGPEGWQATSMNGTNTTNFHGKAIGWKTGGQARTWYVDVSRGQDKKNLLYSPGVSGSTSILAYNAATSYQPGDIVTWAPAAWSASTTYAKGDLVFFEDNHAGGTRYWYKSKTASNLNNAPSNTHTIDTTNWALFAPGTPAQPGLTGNQVYGPTNLYGQDASGVTRYKVYQCVAAPPTGLTAIKPYADAGSNQGSTPNWQWEEVEHGVEVDGNSNCTGVISWGKGTEAPFKTIKYAMAQAKSGDQIICAPGVYKEQLPIRIPAGVGIMGYEMRTTFVEPDMENDNGNGVGISDDGSTPNNQTTMFLCNDSVTVRGFTFRGLTGTVLGTQVGGHTEPTVKGVCFALDPNGGIYQKSPFIQNCCAINPGGGGIFCDGSVGSGRYHSFTTNDFTQINSDGFGLFATNKGRIEAVSVFTYYCHVGYTTTHGGIIRSANGNNSYGYYGSVSEGYDANESAKTGVVDNKTEEAKPYRVVVNTAGANAGQVQWLEWQYAGESYTGSPSVTITAPGDPDAAGAAFNITTASGGIARIKQSGGNTNTLTKALGNAQAGRASGTTANNSATQAEITLAVTDSVANDGYNGMMLFITSGTGSGQYGLIHDYIGATKIAEIKNADNSGGWTSINGETIVAPDTTSVYEIGPAVTITNQGSGTGTGALARCVVTTTNEIEEILILDPGSGYATASADKPLVTIVDPRANAGSGQGNLSPITFTVTVANGVLKSTRASAGSGYPTGVSQGVSQSGQTYATVVDPGGTGFAEIPQTGSYIKVKTLSAEPKAGSQVRFTGSNPTNTTWYQIVNVIGYLNNAATLHLSPKMTTALSPADGEALEIREEYSSCRMTGHDFLDVGTKTYITSNYPGTPTQAADQTKEVLEVCGGRVFYTSTDQDGNFRVGNLFTVQQSTGKATLNAEDFDLAGLQELKFGSLQFGGQSAIVTEFSTDGTMSGNSDTALPTEKAVRTYVTSQLGGGENDLTVNTAIVGTVNLSGNSLTTTAGSNNDLVLNSDSGKASFTAEPQFAGTVTTDHTLINRAYFEDRYNSQGELDKILGTYENDAIYENSGQPASNSFT